jgi:hypothetical protein
MVIGATMARGRRIGLSSNSAKPGNAMLNVSIGVVVRL